MCWQTALTLPSVRMVFDAKRSGSRTSASSAVLVVSVIALPNFFLSRVLSGVVALRSGAASSVARLAGALRPQPSANDARPRAMANEAAAARGEASMTGACQTLALSQTSQYKARMARREISGVAACALALASTIGAGWAFAQPAPPAKANPAPPAPPASASAAPESRPPPSASAAPDAAPAPTAPPAPVASVDAASPPPPSPPKPKPKPDPATVLPPRPPTFLG